MVETVIRSPRHRCAVVEYDRAMLNFDRVSAGWFKRKDRINEAQVEVNAAYDEITAAVKEAEEHANV